MKSTNELPAIDTTTPPVKLSLEDVELLRTICIYREVFLENHPVFQNESPENNLQSIEAASQKLYAISRAIIEGNPVEIG